MFTTDSGFGWSANPKSTGTVRLGDRTVILSERGIACLATRLGRGEEADTAVHSVLYEDRDFGFDVVGWWHFTGRRNPWRMVGRLQICRTVEYGEQYFTATSMITDHTSPTLAHLLGRLARLSAGAARKQRKPRTKGRRRERVLSGGEVWARRAEEGWGPGGY